jgi:hypothetical protein
MSEMVPSGGRSAAPLGGGQLAGPGPGGGGGGNLADVLERVLDKGVVIVGDIRVNLLDIELLTIRLRLLVAGVDTARRIGIDWWEHDPWLSGGAREEEREALEQRLDRIERLLEAGDGGGGDEAIGSARDRDATGSARDRDATGSTRDRDTGDDG